MVLRIGILAFPNVQQLDLTGPYEVFASVPETEVHLVWKDCVPLRSSTGLILQPTTRFAESPDFDILCVPGGAGVNPLIEDEAVIDFVRRQARQARYITSVCTGALILGAAGLLVGRRATTHWNARDLLHVFGAEVSNERVVVDGNLITAGGVTSGIDFGLTVIQQIYGRPEAEIVQLSLEYDPAPPSDAGTPQQASEDVVAAAKARMAASRADRETILARWRKK